jgi:hypothetical protein
MQDVTEESQFYSDCDRKIFISSLSKLFPINSTSEVSGLKRNVYLNIPNINLKKLASGSIGTRLTPISYY